MRAAAGVDLLLVHEVGGEAQLREELLGRCRGQVLLVSCDPFVSRDLCERVGVGLWRHLRALQLRASGDEAVHRASLLDVHGVGDQLEYRSQSFSARVTPHFGQEHHGLHVARGNEIDSHSSCLFAKMRSGTYPRFCLFALLAPGTYPRFLGSPGTYPRFLPIGRSWEHVTSIATS